MVHTPHHARINDEPLCSMRMSVTDHGDPNSNCVGVVVPAGVRERLGISLDTELEIRCHRRRAVVAPAPTEQLGDPLRVDRRRPIARGGSLQVNIPALTRRILGLATGDLVAVRSYPDRCEVVPMDRGESA